MPAAGAQRRDFALVVAARIAELVLRQFGMMEFRLDDVGHDTTFRSGFIFKASRWSPTARAIKRSGIGVPSECWIGTRRTGSMTPSFAYTATIFSTAVS